MAFTLLYLRLKTRKWNPIVDERHCKLPGGKWAGFRVSSSNNIPNPIRRHTKIRNISTVCMVCTITVNEKTKSQTNLCFLFKNAMPGYVICSMPTWKMLSIDYDGIVFIRIVRLQTAGNRFINEFIIHFRCTHLDTLFKFQAQCSLRISLQLEKECLLYTFSHSNWPFVHIFQRISSRLLNFGFSLFLSSCRSFLF